MTYETFQTVLQCATLAALVSVAAASGVCVLAVFLAPVVRWVKRHCIDAILVAPFVVCLVYVGATKHGSVSFPYTDPERRYLYDAGSYVTNGFVHVAFRTLLVPQSAIIYAYSRPNGSTNDAEWVERMADQLWSFSMTEGVHSRDIYFDGAETNDVQVFTDWTPGPVAHTNGIAEIQWHLGSINPSSAGVVPWRTGIYVDGFRVAPDPAMTNGLPSVINLSSTPQQETSDQ